MTTITDILVMAVTLVATVLIASLIGYCAWRYVFAPVIGRTLGAVERRRRPVTEDEYRRVIADERAARDLLRPYGSLEGVSTIQPPVNGHHTTYRGETA